MTGTAEACQLVPAEVILLQPSAGRHVSVVMAYVLEDCQADELMQILLGMRHLASEAILSSTLCHLLRLRTSAEVRASISL
jgi:hypothetical protein